MKNNIKNKFKKSSGYTLVELLTVITIIGILASIAIPNYLGYRDKAKMVTIYSTIHQILLAQEVYWTDFEGFFPGDNNPNPLIGEDGAAIAISGTELSIAIPYGQTWTILSEGSKDTTVKKYTVDITTNFDRDQDGIKDIYFYYRTVGGPDDGLVTNIPNL